MISECASSEVLETAPFFLCWVLMHQRAGLVRVSEELSWLQCSVCWLQCSVCFRAKSVSGLVLIKSTLTPPHPHPMTSHGSIHVSSPAGCVCGNKRQPWIDLFFRFFFSLERWGIAAQCPSPYHPAPPPTLLHLMTWSECRVR